MKFVSALAITVFAAGLVVADAAFALGSAIVVAPSGPAAEPEAASSAAQSGLSKDKANQQKKGTKHSDSANRNAPDVASGSSASMRQSTQ